jgi:putative transposase
MWHHVMNRGARKQPIFSDDGDRKTFLGLVAECAKRFGVVTHAYVLMGNHYHLLVQDEGGRLSRSMRHLDGVYTQGYNRAHGQDGALFKGRYQSRLVSDDDYLLDVFGYIHFNPVKHGFVKRASDWKWSSHRAYLALESAPHLAIDEMMDRFGGRDERTAKKIDHFVGERAGSYLDGIEVGDRWIPFVGDEAFVKFWRAQVKLDASKRGREIPDGKRLAGATVDEVLEAVCDVTEASRDQLLTARRGTSNPARQLAIAVCAWETSARRKEIAEVFGMATASVSVLAARYRDQIAEDEAAQAQLKAVRMLLS